jgi:hypothetical protein
MNDKILRLVALCGPVEYLYDVDHKRLVFHCVADEADTPEKPGLFFETYFGVEDEPDFHDKVTLLHTFRIWATDLPLRYPTVFHGDMVKNFDRWVELFVEAWEEFLKTHDVAVDEPVFQLMQGELPHKYYYSIEFGDKFKFASVDFGDQKGVWHRMKRKAVDFIKEVHHLKNFAETETIYY